jgi:hypothetical protein
MESPDLYGCGHIIYILLRSTKQDMPPTGPYDGSLRTAHTWSDSTTGRYLGTIALSFLLITNYFFTRMWNGVANHTKT